MTFNARFTVQEVGDGPSPINVLAVAAVDDETLTANTEKATSMELRVVIDADETSVAVGDILPVSGHFSG